MPSDTVNIQPGVNVLSVLRHLNYKPWYALGEFVDNAVQSAREHGAELQKLHGGKFSKRYAGLLLTRFRQAAFF